MVETLGTRISGCAVRVEILDAVLPVASVLDEIKAGADGAVCVFDGIVRDNTRGRRTLHLDYEAYREMALGQMEGLAREAVERFGVRDVALLHRLGRLMVGETSVLIAVASAHRGQAFEACRWLIDTLKKQVPIWKKGDVCGWGNLGGWRAVPRGFGVARTLRRPTQWRMESPFQRLWRCANLEKTHAVADGEPFPEALALQ